MELTFLFLLIALATYTVFGGADFGGGLLEATLHKYPKVQKKLQATLGPVWEANHVWLIAVVVILFVGFPRVYTGVCTSLFVPLSLALLGIILRGTFFTFRKYDPEPEKRYAIYSILFRTSSILTPLFFGLMVAALLQPLPNPANPGEATFVDLYIRPWFTWMGLFCAVFVNALFGYLASVLFFGELEDEDEKRLIRSRILGFFAATFVSGGIVLQWGWINKLVDPARIFSPVQLLAQLAAAGGIFWLAYSIHHDRGWQARFAAVLQTAAILAGWVHIRFPVFIEYADGTQLTVRNAAAPQITIYWLNVGLCIVLSLVLPLFVYLFKVFSQEEHT